MNKIKIVTVIGSGLMGSGIAQVSASNGYKVNLTDKSSESLEKSFEVIKKNLERIARKNCQNPGESEKFINDSLGNLKLSTDYRQAVNESDLVIEAIVEKLTIKKDLLKEIDSIAPNQCIFASNTSSLSLSLIADSINRKDKFLGLHFFNPVPVMKLLEIIRTDQTSDQTLEVVKDFGKGVKKSIVTCKDTPGFVVNRLLVPYLVESFRMLERGVSTHKEIDTAMKLGAGHPMGPFELADYIGLDTIKFIMDGWSSEFPEEPNFRKCDILDKLVLEGKFGRKSGSGFYSYDSKGNQID